MMMSTSQLKSILQREKGIDERLIRRIIIESERHSCLRVHSELVGMLRVAACYPQHRVIAMHYLLDAVVLGKIEGFDTLLITSQVKSYKNRVACASKHEIYLLRIALAL